MISYLIFLYTALLEIDWTDENKKLATIAKYIIFRPARSKYMEQPLFDFIVR